jgi:hypothetical protein
MSLWSRIKGKLTERADVQLKPAPVVAEPYARGVEAEFRLPDDPEHVIRINRRADWLANLQNLLRLREQLSPIRR